MRHDSTESRLGVAIIIDLALFKHIHDSVLSPFVIVHPSVVGSVGDKGVLCPGIIVVWTTGQEPQRNSIFVLQERMGEAAVRVLLILFTTALRRIRVRKEDAVLGGQVDVMVGILLVSCGVLESHGMNSASFLKPTTCEGSCGKLVQCHRDHVRIIPLLKFRLRKSVYCSGEQDEACND